MTGPSAGDLAIGAAGALIVLVAVADLFVTVFNYDGFDFLANRLRVFCGRLCVGFLVHCPTARATPLYRLVRRRCCPLRTSFGSGSRSLETIVGLTTFTLALGLRRHNVRRAEDP